MCDFWMKPPKLHAEGLPGCDPTWFPNNVARNSPINLSNIEIVALRFQRLCAMSKTDQGKLCATFGGRIPRSAPRPRATPADSAADFPASSNTPAQAEKL